MNHRFFIVLLALLNTALSFGASAKQGFTLWQLPPQTPSQMNSYVFLTDNGKVCVMDGGMAGDAPYLRGFLAALGNEVEAWFISHPHQDHLGALNEILKAPNGLTIHTIYHSELSKAFYEQHELGHKELTAAYYATLGNFSGKVVNLTEPGMVIDIGDTHFKILGVKNEEITNNPYNNQSMVIKVWDNQKSVLFLGDIGIEAGDKLWNGPYRGELNCDYLQMAHHGQNGVRKDFYRNIRFKACLWPTPRWLHDNDAGKGYNTHTWETIEIRELMDEIGIKKHYWAFEGLHKIE
ncbi:ComEC/Rec2 family competence protein [Parapedobacter sp. DT-150]|uniref:ComEC/Rec2 family competence protein n=1 Tax=Parapedobacter sp. DT-150 TaxID=3396162 RepID=UPI003F19AB45